MSLIKLGPLETVTSLSVTTTLGDSLEKEDFQSTSISALSTSLASSVVDKPNVELNITQKYIDSLSDSQLAEMVERLSQKEDDLTFLTINVQDAEQYGNEEETGYRVQPVEPTMPPYSEGMEQQPVEPTQPPYGGDRNMQQPQPTQPVRPTEPPQRSR